MTDVAIDPDRVLGNLYALREIGKISNTYVVLFYRFCGTVRQ